MRECAGLDKEKLIEDLQGSIYRIPNTDKYVTSDEYLSSLGNGIRLIIQQLISFKLICFINNYSFLFIIFLSKINIRFNSSIRLCEKMALICLEYFSAHIFMAIGFTLTVTVTSSSVASENFMSLPNQSITSVTIYLFAMNFTATLLDLSNNTPPQDK